MIEDPIRRKLATEMERTAEELVMKADQLLRLARELIGVSGALSDQRLASELVQAVEAEEKPKEEPQETERSVGRYGIVNHSIALVRAQELREFTKAEFAEKLGLRVPATTRWLASLVDAQEVVFDGGRYRCLSPPKLRDWITRQEGPFSPGDAARMAEMSPEDALQGLEEFARRGMVETNASGLFVYVPPKGGSLEHETKPPPELDRPSYELAPSRGEPIRIRKDTRKQRSTPGQRHQIVQREKRYQTLEEAKERRAEEQRTKAGKSNNRKRRNGRG